jgi:putative alpha-1,2-mannosidase
MYKNKPDGLSGNDDCGQMSAWYIFSVLGFYPVAPGSNEYVIGSPCVKSASINLENGKQFNMEVANYAEKNVYIKEVYLNNKIFNRTYIKHDEIINGGKLKFVMSSTPNKKWGSDESTFPFSLTK